MKASHPLVLGAFVAATALPVLCANVKAQVDLKDFIFGETPRQSQWQPKTLPREKRTTYLEPRYRTAHRPQMLRVPSEAKPISDYRPKNETRPPERVQLRWTSAKTASKIRAKADTPARVKPTGLVARPNTPTRVISTVLQSEPEEVETPAGEVSKDTLPEHDVLPERTLPDDAYIFDDPDAMDDYVFESECESCGDDYADCGGYGCEEYAYGGYFNPCGMWLHHLRSVWWTRDLSLFAGVHAFKGPVDRGRNGNFGLHEGVNYGGPIGGFSSVGYQVGFAAVHSNFSGDQVDGARRGDRDQFFLTTGLFRRAPCGGWQWGVAFDLLRDVYYDRFDLGQIRAELGHVSLDGTREVGFFGAFGARNDNFVLQDETEFGLEPTDMFAFYYRRHLGDSRDGRFWAGFTGNGDALLGADLHAPIGKGWALANRVNYLIPRQGGGSDGQVEESWGVSIHLVWYIGQPARTALKSPFRPMFDVADNATFMAEAFER